MKRNQYSNTKLLFPRLKKQLPEDSSGGVFLTPGQAPEPLFAVGFRLYVPLAEHCFYFYIAANSSIEKKCLQAVSLICSAVRRSFSGSSEIST